MRKTAALMAAAAVGAAAAAAIVVEVFFTPGRPHVQFEGEGFLLRKNFASDGIVALSWTNYFKVIVRDFEWRIVTQRANQKPDFTEAGFDGNELITVTHFENYMKQQIQRGGVVGMNSAGANVQYSPIPNMLGENSMLPVWFAYASQCYLDNSHPGYLPPFSDADLAGDDLPLTGREQRAQLTRRTAPPGLPERAVLFNDGLFPGALGIPRASPHNQEFTNVIFEALGFTNLAGVDIPTRCTLRHYMAETGAKNTNDISCDYESYIYLTNLSSTISVTRFRPEFPNGVVHVRDRRFNGPRSFLRLIVKLMETKVNPAIMERLFGDEARYVPNLYYFTTQSNWLTTREVRQLPEYKTAAAQAPRLAALPAQTNVNVYYHPLNFPHSLRTRPYPNTFLLIGSFTVFALACSFLLRLGIRKSK